MRTYASSRVKRKTCFRKSELQMFLMISGGHIGTPTWRLHRKLFKGAWNVSPNTSETVGHKDQRLGREIVYILVFYKISFSWLLPLDGFQFIFCCVTVKTIYWETKLNDPQGSYSFLNKKFKDFSRTHPIFQGPHSVRKRDLSPCLFYRFYNMSNCIVKVFLCLLL